MSTTHLANRVAMAQRLADFLDRHDAGNPDQLETRSDQDWQRIAELAGETRTPSRATRAAVIAILRERHSTDDSFGAFAQVGSR